MDGTLESVKWIFPGAYNFRVMVRGTIFFLRMQQTELNAIWQRMLIMLHKKKAVAYSVWWKPEILTCNQDAFSQENR